MIPVKFSEKIESYMKKVQAETGREIFIEKIKGGIGQIHAAAAFDRAHPNKIHILISDTILKSSSDVERAIAHEVTHGLLMYRKEKPYAFIVPKNVRPLDMEVINAISSMIDDIVVNKIVQDNGFPPYAEMYPGRVDEEIKILRKGKVYCENITGDIRDTFMVWRYILAWGFLEYYNGLETWFRSKLKKFLKKFEESYPKQFCEAQKIKDIIKSEDIFSDEGHNKILKQILEFWKLEKSCEIKTINN